jgi:hypothetical protein
MADDIQTDETLPDIKGKDADAARKEGVLEAIKDSAKQQFLSTDGVAVTSDPEPGITVTNDATHMDYLLDLDPQALKDTLTGKDKAADGPLPTQGQIASLLEMECSGKNRADVIEVLCDVLGIKSPREVTNAGPGYANVVSRKAYADVKGA